MNLRRPAWATLALAWTAALAILIAAACQPPVVVVGDPPATHRLVPRTPTPAPTARLLSGTVTLTQDGLEVDNRTDECRGSGQFAYLVPGVDVLVLDSRGTIVATTHLSAGTLGSDSRACVFEFGPVAVPNTAIYQVDVARRGRVTFSRDELVAQDWTVGLTIGE